MGSSSTSGAVVLVGHGNARCVANTRCSSGSVSRSRAAGGIGGVDVGGGGFPTRGANLAPPAVPPPDIHR